MPGQVRLHLDQRRLASLGVQVEEGQGLSGTPTAHPQEAAYIEGEIVAGVWLFAHSSNGATAVITALSSLLSVPSGCDILFPRLDSVPR